MTKELNRTEELNRWQKRYERRNREGRSRMLDEFCEQYGYERKYAIKLLGNELPAASGKERSGPPCEYQPLLEVVERIWSAAEQLCGKRLAPALGIWLPHYEVHYGKLLPSQKKLLGQVSAATLDQNLPGIPDATANLATLEKIDRAVLHQISLSANFNHPSGFFAQWESAWYRQSSASLPGDDFWQHDVYLGYRFPRRYAELRFGLLNLFDTDYRLNPLNLHSDLPRNRTFTTSLRLNF